MGELILRYGEDNKIDYYVTKLTGIGLVEVPQRFGRVHEPTASIDFDGLHINGPGNWLSRHEDVDGEPFIEPSAEEYYWQRLHMFQDELDYDVSTLRKVAYEAKLSAKETELMELIMSGSPVKGEGAIHSLSIALDVSQARVRGLLARLRGKMDHYLSKED